MEDLRFRSPITDGKRPEVDLINTASEDENSKRTDFRSFLTESYSQTSNNSNDSSKTDSDLSGGAAEQVSAPLDETVLPVSTSQTLAIHARSKEIGRVIFTGDPTSEDRVHVNIESLNSGADALLSRLVDDASGSSKVMVDYIRETMLGATEVASSISKAGFELNDDRLAITRSSNTNSWSEFTQQINSELSRPLISPVNLRTELQPFLAASDVVSAEAGGVNKDQITSNIGQVGDLAKLAKTPAMEFVTEAGSADHDSMQASMNGFRGESGDQGGPNRDLDKQDADGEPSDSERNRQDWRERFAEVISDRIKVKVDEGEWLVRMSLQAAGLGGFDVSLKSDDTGVSGSIHADDPQVRELLRAALPELELALNESLSFQAGQKVRLEVLDTDSLGENTELADSSEIVLTASELSNCLPGGFKSGDGLDVFV